MANKAVPDAESPHNREPKNQTSDETPTRGLAQNTAIMASGTLVSRILGLVRNALLVATIGALSGGMADAFAVANTLPNIIYNLLAGGVLNAILVPQIVRALKHRERGQDYVNRLLTIGGLGLLIVTVLLTLSSTLLINLYASSFSGEWKNIAIILGYWCIPQVFFYGLYTLIGQVLNARSNFGPYMWAPVVNNVIAIAGLVVFLVMFGSISVDTPPSQWSSTMITVLAGTATLGVVFQAVVLFIPLRKIGFKYRPRLKAVALPGLGNTGKFAGWVFAGLAVAQLSFLAISNVGAAAGNEMAEMGIKGAGNAAYSNAFMIMMLPQSLVTISLVTAMFTQLSKSAAEWNHQRIKADMSFGIRTLGVFSVLATALLMVLAIPVTQVVQFDRADYATYEATGNVLVGLALALIPLAIWTVNMRVYYAYSDAKSMFSFQLIMGISAAAGAGIAVLTLPPQWWVAGAGVSLSVSYGLGALISYLALRRKLPSIDGARILGTYLRLVIAILPAAFAGWGLLHLWGVETGLLGAILRVLVIGLVITGMYAVTLRLLGVSEFNALVSRLARMVAPITRRVNPLLSKLPGANTLRTIWERLDRSEPIEGERVAPEAPILATAGEVLAGRYRIDAALETEPLATFAATDQILDQHVQLTIIADERREAVLTAARRTALITHSAFPKVLRVIDEKSRGLIISVAQEYTSLTALISQGGLNADLLRTIVGESAQALDTARKRGAHHQGLSPLRVGITTDNALVISGLGTDAPALGLPAADQTEAARADAVGLVQLIHAGLYGTWFGNPQTAGHLPLAAHLADSQKQLNELDPALVELCETTLDGTEDGPFTPAEVVAALTPWKPLDSFDHHRPWLPTLTASQLSATTAFDQIVEPVQDLPATPARHTGVAEVVAPIPGSLIPSEPDPEPTSESESAPGLTSEPAPTQVPQLDTEPQSDTEPQLAPEAESASEAQTAPATQPAPAPEREPEPEPDFGADMDVANAPLPISPRIAALIAQGGTTSTAKANSLAGVGAGVSAGLATGMEKVVSASKITGKALKSGFNSTSAWLGDKINRLNEPRNANAGPRSTLAQVAAPSAASPGSASGATQGAASSGFIPEDEPVNTSRPAASIILTLMVAVVVFALFASLNNLRNAPDAYVPVPPRTPVPAEPTAEPTTDEPEDPADDEPEPVDPTTPAPQITGATTYDPTYPAGENQDTAYRIYDRDRSTAWHSLRYNNPTYGVKDGLGVTLELEEEAMVSKVVLHVDGSGGLVEVRVGGGNPDEGTVVAEGPMSNETVFELEEPVAASAVKLWFPELPQSSRDGRNRIELAEVELS